MIVEKTNVLKYDEFHSGGNEILVLGIGNYLMGDEGVGVHFINRIEPSEFPQGISFIDGGTGGFILVPYIENHKKVIIVDATMDGKEEGTITLLKPKFSNDFPIALSGHNFGLKDMVDILTMSETMPEIYLYTITISKMEPMFIGLSPKVDGAIKEVKAKVIQLIENFNKK